MPDTSGDRGPERRVLVVEDDPNIRDLVLLHLGLEGFGTAAAGDGNDGLKLAKSEPFPTAVVGYRQGKLSDKVLTQFKTGMLKANDSEKGRDVMANFSITSFEPVAEDYPKQLSAILKAYPVPGK